MTVRVLIDRPTLPAALRALGLTVVNDTHARLAIVRADSLGDARCCPGARSLAVARDEAEEHAALLAGVDDVARGSDTLVSLRARRLLLPAISLALDRLARIATRAGRSLTLLPREYALLDLLARHAGDTVPHAVLRQALFGLPFHPGTNVLAVHVSRLRAQLDRAPLPPMLVTDRGRGYRLVPDHPLPSPPPSVP